MRRCLLHIFSRACRGICVLGLLCVLSACHWQEARDVITVADSIDQNHHVIYGDTAALGQTIRTLDNPLGRLLMSNTLGKAYYYMGRNLEDSYCQIPEAAQCYIEADRLRIDDPIYRGRVNSCMGYICEQNSNDSLAVIFYKYASKDFDESGNEYYYAQNLLEVSESYIYLHDYSKVDSLLNLLQHHFVDSLQGSSNKIRGLYFYERQQYDSAIVYYNKCISDIPDCPFVRMKLMQTYYKMNLSHLSVPYAEWIISNSRNPNYRSNAYYILLSYAKKNNEIELVVQYSHKREDEHRNLDLLKSLYSIATEEIEEYNNNPHPFRWIIIVLASFIVLCVSLIIGIIIYCRFATTQILKSTEQITSLSAQIQEQEDELQKQNGLQLHDKRLKSIRKKYPKPLNQWNEYAKLKKDLQPYLLNWFLALENLELTNRENVFCVVSFVYPQMAAEDFASFLCITKEALIVRKNRIAKKLGLTSMELGRFLQNLANNE